MKRPVLTELLALTKRRALTEFPAQMEFLALTEFLVLTEFPALTEFLALTKRRALTWKNIFLTLPDSAAPVRLVPAGYLPDCPKSPRETEILRTPIQGQKRILDSH